jgi:Na+-driven multidrug efflux pump
MLVSVFVESALTTWATRRVLRSDHSSDTDLTLRALWRFYSPLLATSVINQSRRPLVSTGIAAAAVARSSLAAWPVVWGFVVLFTAPAWSLQQLTTALATNRAAQRSVRRFSLTLGAFLTLLLALVTFTPLYHLVFRSVYALPSDLRDLARPAMQCLVVFPLLSGALSSLRGTLIREGDTKAVRAATLVEVCTLGLALLVGVTRLSSTGVMLAAAATLAGSVAGLTWLLYRSKA